MANVIFKSYEDEVKKAGAGLASNVLKDAKNLPITFDSHWEKAGHNRTKEGKGSLGVNTTIDESYAWMNASQLISFIHKMTKKPEGLIKENKTAKTFELVCDGTTVYLISGDKDGNITGLVKKG